MCLKSNKVVGNVTKTISTVIFALFAVPLSLSRLTCVHPTASCRGLAGHRKPLGGKQQSNDHELVCLAILWQSEYLG